MNRCTGRCGVDFAKNRFRGMAGIAIEDCEDGTDRGFFACVDEDFREGPIIESFHFHGRLVGFNLGEDVADFDWIADLFVPFDKGALGHGVREFGHFDVHRHGRIGKCGEDGKTRSEFQSFYGWMW